MTLMRAVGSFTGLPIENPESFVDVWLEKPQAKGHDILVKVQAVALNPVDTKFRQSLQNQTEPKILGYDAVGEIVALGEAVTKFTLGQRVYYAGSSQRAGSNQEFQLVDEAVAAVAPTNLPDEAAASVPLTALTAYELLFEKFGLGAEPNANAGKNLLIINGAGGVGRMVSQLAAWAGLTVFATASSRNFDLLRENQVTVPLDYHQPLRPQVQQAGIEKFDYIAVLYDIRPYFEKLVELIAPFGHIGNIVGVAEPLNISQLKNLSVSFDWEYMFAKTDQNFHVESQGAILAHIATLFEAEQLKTAIAKVYPEINATTMREATAEVEAGQTAGKIILKSPFTGKN